ncbi:MAG: TlpA disulfide reductase family protein [Chloroflexota bacterium]
MDKLTKVILLMILVLGLWLSGCRAVSQPPPETSSNESVITPTEGTQVGNLAPNFQLKNLDGQIVSLAGLRGKPVLVNFWATWCPPCRFEMPFLQQIYEEWSDRGLILLTIDIGENQTLVEEFLKTNSLTMPVLLDSERSVSRMYTITVIPTTFFIDRDGVIQGRKFGAFSNKEEIEVYLGKIIP